DFDTGIRLRGGADLLADLAFGSRSVTSRRLVLGEQIVELLDAGASANRDPGLLDIYARIKDPSRVDEVVAVLDETAERFRSSPPDEAKLAALKSRLKYAFLMGFETPDRAAERVARHLAIRGDLHGLEALYAAYDDVTPDDVRAAAEVYLVPERRTLGI